LRVTGGKERIASYIERLRLPATERRSLQGLIPEIHRAKTRLYRQLLQVGQVKARSGVRRLVMEARNAGIRVGIASTTSPDNIEPLVTAGLGSTAMSWFDTIATGDVVANKKPAPDIYNVALQSWVLLQPAPSRWKTPRSASNRPRLRAVHRGHANIWTRGQDFTAADLLLGSLVILTSRWRPPMRRAWAPGF